MTQDSGGDDDSDLAFEADFDEPPDTSGELTKLEMAQFGKTPKDNAVVIPLWKGGYISFNPRDSVAIFALLALVLLIVITVFQAFLGIWIGEAEWMQTMSGALGHAITGVVGAIVGSAATKGK